MPVLISHERLPRRRVGQRLDVFVPPVSFVGRQAHCGLVVMDDLAFHAHKFLYLIILYDLDEKSFFRLTTCPWEMMVFTS